MELISQTLIKPVSPAASHLKSYEYSVLDQLAPSNYTPIFLYYPPPTLLEDHNQEPKAVNSSRLQRLKKSLSEVLPHYYPLAGRLETTTFVLIATMEVSHSINLFARLCLDLYLLTSRYGFEVYDVDYGWEKPIFYRTIEVKLRNFALLMDAKDGGGEAQVVLSEEDMKMFEKNTELLTYATLKASFTN